MRESELRLLKKTDFFFREIKSMIFFLFQVLQSRGNAGHNVEYVLKLANWIRETIPEVLDDHLFKIEQDIRRKIKLQNLCLSNLMGEDDHEPHGLVEVHGNGNHVAGNERESGSDNNCNTGFSAQVRPKCLRCLKC